MLTEREKQICGRLRQFREGTAIARTKFALMIRVSGERLASYESARARLPYGVARKIPLEFWINEAWLAEGTGERSLLLDAGPDRPDTIPDGMPFSEAYDSFLKPLLDARSKSLKSADPLFSGKRVRSGLGIYEKMRETLLRRVHDDIESVPGKVLPDYLAGWNALCKDVKHKHGLPRGGEG